jgi:hypothetical protein
MRSLKRVTSARVAFLHAASYRLTDQKLTVDKSVMRFLDIKPNASQPVHTKRSSNFTLSKNNQVHIVTFSS